MRRIADDKRKCEMKELFKSINSAVNAMSECCCVDKNIESPVAESEVFNETWMLRMILALIHDYSGDFVMGNGDVMSTKKNALEQIRVTVRRKWISEGGLKPAFTNEGTTWTDAILGDIKLSDTSSRGIDVDPHVNNPVGIVVVEAKMGSNISPDISNSNDYNQVARNIACLAKLTMGYESLYEHSRMVVLVPEGWWKKHKSSKPLSLYSNSRELLNHCSEVIKNQDNPQNPKKRSKNEINSETGFEKAIERIISNSSFITWDEIIKSINSPEAKVVDDFYKRAKKCLGLPT